MQDNVIFKASSSTIEPASTPHIILKSRRCKTYFSNQLNQLFQYLPFEEENFQICFAKKINSTILRSIQLNHSGNYCDKHIWKKGDFAREKELANLHLSQQLKQSMAMENGNSPNYFTKIGY